jgi:hypothetical protein
MTVSRELSRYRIDLVGVQEVRWEGNGTERLLIGKPEGKRPLGRPRRRWMDNINMGLVQIG